MHVYIAEGYEDVNPRYQDLVQPSSKNPHFTLEWLNECDRVAVLLNLSFRAETSRVVRTKTGVKRTRVTKSVCAFPEPWYGRKYYTLQTDPLNLYLVT